MTVETDDAVSYSVGLRYLTTDDTTYILEYYHNGKGYTEDEMKDFYSFADTAYQTYISTENDTLLTTAGSVSNAYGGQNPMRDYLYLRVSHKEPFDILYLTPAITGVLNLNDKSFTLAPELICSWITNTDIRFKVAVLSGSRETEYGEKLNDYKVEFMSRYYF